MVSRGLLRLLLGLYPATQSVFAKRMPVEAIERLVTQIKPRIGEAIEQLFQQTPESFRKEVKALVEKATQSPKELGLHPAYPIENLQYVVGTALRAVQQYPQELYTRPALPRSAIPQVRHAIRQLGATPRPVYHVTTDLPAVLQQGLRLQPPGSNLDKLLIELSTLAGTTIPPSGLGGTQTIAAAYVTPSKAAAVNSARALKTAAKLARNEMSLIDAILMDVPAIMKTRSRTAPFVLETTISDMIKTLMREDADNIPFYYSVKDKVNEAFNTPRLEETYSKLVEVLKALEPYINQKLSNQAILDLYKSYLFNRGLYGEISNPALLGNLEQYKQIDPNKIGILEIYTLPYALIHGTKPVKTVPALKELIEGMSKSAKTSPDLTQLKLVRPSRAWIFESTILPLLWLLLKLRPQEMEGQG